MSTWSARVKRGKNLAEREAKGIREVAALRFALGDEILAVREEAEHGEASVEKYAAEIGISRPAAFMMAAVAEAFPEKVSSGRLSPREFNASYSVFRELAPEKYNDVRSKVISKLNRRKPAGRYWTVDEVREEIGREPTRKPAPTAREVVKAASPEEKAAIVREIAKESPDVIADAVTDINTRVAVSKAVGAHQESTEKEHKERAAKDPLQVDFALIKTTDRLGQAIHDLGMLVNDGVAALDEEAREHHVEMIEHYGEALAMIVSVLKGGGNLDNDFAELLGGGTSG